MFLETLTTSFVDVVIMAATDLLTLVTSKLNPLKTLTANGRKEEEAVKNNS